MRVPAPNGRNFDIETIPDGKLYVFMVLPDGRRMPAGVLSPGGRFEAVTADDLSTWEKGPGGWGILRAKLQARFGLDLPDAARPPWA